MLVKCLEIRDRNTFIPVMCFRPIPENELQRYLLARDGWSCSENEHCVIVIDTHRNRAMHNPYEYPSNGARTLPFAHRYIEQHWHELHDGDVVDVEFILGETTEKKQSERYAEA